MSTRSVKSGLIALAQGCFLAGALSACVQAIPAELVSAIETIDQQLVDRKSVV